MNKEAAINYLGRLQSPVADEIIFMLESEKCGENEIANTDEKMQENLNKAMNALFEIINAEETVKNKMVSMGFGDNSNGIFTVANDPKYLKNIAKIAVKEIDPDFVFSPKDNEVSNNISFSLNLDENSNEVSSDKNRIKELETQLAQIDERSSELFKQYETSCETNKVLREQNEQFKNQLNQVDERCIDLFKQYETAYEENKQLHSNNKLLVDKNQELNKKIATMSQQPHLNNSNANMEWFTEQHYSFLLQFIDSLIVVINQFSRYIGTFEISEINKKIKIIHSWKKQFTKKNSLF